MSGSGFITLGNASIPGEMNADELSTYATLVSIILLIIIIVLSLLRKALKVVRHSEVMIVERFGRYKTTLKPGLHFLWPIIEEPRCIKWRQLDVSRFTHAATAKVVQVDSEVVDMREHVIDFGKQVRRGEGEQGQGRGRRACVGRGWGGGGGGVQVGLYLKEPACWLWSVSCVSEPCNIYNINRGYGCGKYGLVHPIHGVCTQYVARRPAHAQAYPRLPHLLFCESITAPPPNSPSTRTRNTNPNLSSPPPLQPPP